MCFDLQLCVKLVRRARIIGIDLLHPCFEAAESNLIATQAAPIEPQRLPRQPRKEGAIMADDDECPRITIEPAFQPVNRGKIKMVRRLIEQQQIRLTRQRTANGRSAALTARCGFGQTRKIKDRKSTRLNSSH